MVGCDMDSGGVPNPEASVRTNIDEFRQSIEEGDFSNRQVARAVEGAEEDGED